MNEETKGLSAKLAEDATQSLDAMKRNLSNAIINERLKGYLHGTANLRQYRRFNSTGMSTFQTVVFLAQETQALFDDKDDKFDVLRIISKIVKDNRCVNEYILCGLIIDALCEYVDWHDIALDVEKYAAV